MTACTILWAKTSGWSRASATVSGSSGQPGAIVAYPLSSNSVRQRSQLLDSSHSPWTKATGWRPDSFARSISSCSRSLSDKAASWGVVRL